MSAGGQWNVWSGGIGDCGIAMLLSVVLGGYHAFSTYQWSKDELQLTDETYPVIYVRSRGKYVCTCSISSGDVTVQLAFTVSGGN